MQNKLATIIVFTIVIVGVSVFYVFTAPSAHVPPIRSNTSASSSPPVASASNAPSHPGAYVNYSPGIIASTSGTKLLFFHAPWCPQCQALEKDIQSTALPDNLTIIKVDYDTQNDLRVKYGVTLQTTIVKISNNGDLIKKFVAYSEPSFANIKQNLLE
jgi:thiol-disulfide isomerase/thioredoxin